MFWGGAFVAGKIAASEIGPFSIAFVRFFIASVMLVILAKSVAPGSNPVKARHFLWIAILGIIGVAGYNALFFKGLAIIPASRGALIIATCPVCISLLSAMFGIERLNRKKLTGICISLAGAAIVISKGSISELFGGSVGLGEVLMFMCVLCWAAYSLLGKKMMKELSPLKLVAYSSVVGTIALLFGALGEGMLQEIYQYSLKSWVCILYMAVFATVIGFLWYYEGIKKIGAVKAGLFINFVPVWAIIFSMLILKEAVTFSLFAGGILVICGVFLTNRA